MAKGKKKMSANHKKIRADRPNGKAFKQHPKSFANGKLYCRNHGDPIGAISQ